MYYLPIYLYNFIYLLIEKLRFKGNRTNKRYELSTNFLVTLRHERVTRVKH